MFAQETRCTIQIIREFQMVVAAELEQLADSRKSVAHSPPAHVSHNQSWCPPFRSAGAMQPPIESAANIRRQIRLYRTLVVTQWQYRPSMTTIPQTNSTIAALSSEANTPPQRGQLISSSRFAPVSLCLLRCRPRLQRFFVACVHYTGFPYTAVDTWGLLSGIGRGHLEM